MVGTDTASPATRQGTDWHRLTAQEACQQLSVDPAVGLSTAEVERQRLLGTVDLDKDEWRVILIAVIAYTAVSEVFEFFARRLGSQEA